MLGRHTTKPGINAKGLNTMRPTKLPRRLSIQLGIAVVVIEIVFMFAVGILFYQNFSHQVDQRQQEKLIVASQMLGGGGLNLTALGDRIKMSALVGDTIADGMLIDTNNTVVFSLDPQYRRVPINQVQFLSEDKINTARNELVNSDVNQPINSAEAIFDVLYIGNQQFIGSYYPFNPGAAAGQGIKFRYVLFFRTNTTAIQTEKNNVAILILAGFLATAIATSLVIYLFFNRSVLRRVDGLARVMQQVEQGDLSARVTSNPKPADAMDELDALEQSFDKMLVARVSAENAVHRSAEQLRAVISNLPLLTWVVDEKDKIIFLDGNLLKELGIAPEKLLGTHVSDLYKDVQPAHVTAFVRAKAGESTFVPAALLGDRYLENYYIPLYDTSRKFEGVLGVIFDVTARTLAQLEREELLNTLEQRVQERTRDLTVSAEISRQAATVLSQQKLLSKLVNMTREAFNLYQVSIFSFNPQSETLDLVAASGEAGIKMLEQSKQFHLDEQPGLVPLAARTQQHALFNDVNASPEHKVNPLLPNTQAEMAIPFTFGGEVLGVLDIQSEQKDHFTENEKRVFGSLANQIAVAVRNAKLFEEVLDARERAETSDRVKSAFLASMSHELRTPLNAIINFSKFLRKGIPGPINEEQEQLIGSIAESGQHLLSLINDVLDMSKIEAGALKLFVEENIDMSDILHTAIRYTLPLLTDKTVTLQEDIPESLFISVGDRKRLLQIMLNILSNACKFTEEGHIKVAAICKDGHLLVSVKDTGPGIAAEDYEAVFTPFKQTDSGLRKGGGTGLGMPICKKLIEAHDGQIWFESVVGQGTTFFIDLPVKPSFIQMQRTIDHA